MKKELTHNRGFSVAGLLVAAGVMSGLALVLSQLSKRQMIIQRKAETGVEIAELSQRITRTLQDGDACLATMAQIATPLANGSTHSINSVMNGSGAFLTVNNVYRNRLIRINAIDLTDVSIPPPPDDNIGELNLQVTFVKNSKAITGYNKVIKKFPLAVELDSANTLTNNVLGCLSLQDGALTVAKRELCPQMGGIYNSDGTCTSRLLGQECPGDATATPPIPQQYLRGIDNSHNLICAPPPPPTSPIPPGYNCYLLTTYSHQYVSGGAYPWWPKKPPLHPSNVSNSKIHRWRVVLDNRGYYPQRFIAGTDGDYRSKASCASGYSEYFHLGMNISNRELGLIFHYCCR